jgi:hypothetical protein
MTAVDQSGSRVVRYRRTDQEVEVVVHPQRQLTDELTLAIAISALPPPYGPHTAAGAGPGIPRSPPPSRRRSCRSRWSARSEARTNDLKVQRGDGHTRPRGRPLRNLELASEATTAKENPGHRLTATAKRTRYALQLGAGRACSGPRRAGRSACARSRLRTPDSAEMSALPSCIASLCPFKLVE